MKLTDDELTYLTNRGHSIQDITTFAILEYKDLIDTILHTKRFYYQLQEKNEELAYLVEYIKAIDIVLPNTSRKHFNDMYNEIKPILK